MTHSLSVLLLGEVKQQCVDSTSVPPGADELVRRLFCAVCAETDVWLNWMSLLYYLVSSTDSP